MSITEVIDPVYSFLPDDVYEASTISSKYVEYRPEEVILNAAGNDNVSNNFTIIMDNHQSLVKLSDAVVDVKYRLINSTNDAVYPSTTIASIGANAQLMFQNVKLSIQSKSIEEIEFPGYCNTVRSLMELPGPYIERNGPVEGLWLEKARSRTGDEDDITTNPTVYTWSAGAAHIQQYNVDAVSFAIESKSQIFNKSYKRRFFQTQGSSPAEISIPLRSIFKFADAYDGVLKGSDIELAFTKQTDYKLVLHAVDGTQAPRLVITDLRLRVPVLTPSASASLQLQEQLNSSAVSKLIYPNWHTRFSQTYDYNTTYQKWKANTLTRPPLYCFVMFQIDKCYANINDDTTANVKTSTDFIANPLKFKSAASNGGGVGFTDISRVTLYVGGDRKPEQDWRMDFTANDFSQVYSEFLRVCGKAPYGDSEEESFCDAETFKLQYPMFAFDLRPAANKFFGEGNNSIDLEVEWQVEAGASGNYRAVVVYSDERCVNFGSVGGQLMIDPC